MHIFCSSSLRLGIVEQEPSVAVARTCHSPYPAFVTKVHKPRLTSSTFAVSFTALAWPLRTLTHVHNTLDPSGSVKP